MSASNEYMASYVAALGPSTFLGEAVGRLSTLSFSKELERKYGFVKRDSYRSEGGLVIRGDIPDKGDLVRAVEELSSAKWASYPLTYLAPTAGEKRNSVGVVFISPGRELTIRFVTREPARGSNIGPGVTILPRAIDPDR